MVNWFIDWFIHSWSWIHSWSQKRIWRFSTKIPKLAHWLKATLFQWSLSFNEAFLCPVREVLQFLRCLYDGWLWWWCMVCCGGVKPRKRILFFIQQCRSAGIPVWLAMWKIYFVSDERIFWVVQVWIGFLSRGSKFTEVYTFPTPSPENNRSQLP